MAKTIEQLTALTAKQERLCREMEALYDRMEQAGIAFAQNEDGHVVVYNASGIDDCETCDVWGNAPEGYEYLEQNDMRRLFPVWCCDTLYVSRK